jgi:hypothetical protein
VQSLALVGLIPIAAGYGANKFLEYDRRIRSMQCLILCSILFSFMIFGIGAARIAPYQETPLFIEQIKKHCVDNEYELATYDYFQPNLVYYSGKRVTELRTTQQVGEFLRGRRFAFVIIPKKRHNELMDEIQGHIVELASYHEFLRGRELILLGHPTAF